MRKSRFSESQIIGMLKSVEAGRLVKDVCREHGISDATYYQWKSKYGGMEAADIATALADWAQQHNVELEFIERFNRSYREGVLDMYVFRTLEEVRERTEVWKNDYNEALPHDALGDLTSVEYRVLHHPETSSYGWH